MLDERKCSVDDILPKVSCLDRFHLDMDKDNSGSAHKYVGLFGITSRIYVTPYAACSVCSPIAGEL